MSTRRELVGRIRHLSATFLPPASPTGAYSRSDYDRTSAFILLSHAEVEWYIERRCLWLLNAAVSAWEVDSKPRSTIIALAAFSHAMGGSAVPEVNSGATTIRAVIKDAKKTYSTVVNNNNGIKEKDLLKLLLPIGLRESQFPSGFLLDMESFGAKRGDRAHRAVGATTPPDPVDTKALLVRIVAGLRRLDQAIEKLALE